MSGTSGRNFVTQYANNAHGWDSIPAVFKLLYSDFIVIEIPEEGRPLEPALDDATNDTDLGVVEEGKRDEDEGKGCIPAALGSDFTARIEKLAGGEGEDEKTVTVSTEGLSKEERKGIHEYVRVHYGDQLCSTTENNSLTIKRIGNDGVVDRRTKRRIWPADRPDYLHFTVTKENRDCQWVVGLLSRLCHLRPQSFSMAGTKDRRAITSQRMSVYRMERSRMQEVAKGLRHGVWLTDFCYRPEKLSLGALWGNRFHIVLREIDVGGLETETIAHRIGEWQQIGFLNYFGAQRFGTCGVNTSEVGRLILSSRWKEAVGALLKPREESHGRLGEALRHFAEHNDPAAALRLLSQWGGDSKRRQEPQLIESSLLTSLKRDKNAHKSAILALPRDTRSLYIHAYQSLLFNRAVTERVAEHGLRVLEADVGVNGEKLKSANNEAHDVYIPLPSAKSFSMDDDASRRYRQFMEEDGVDPSAFSALERYARRVLCEGDHHKCTNFRQFSTGEVLRPMLIKPRAVHWEVVKYNEPREILQQSPFTSPSSSGSALLAKSEKSREQGPHWTLKLRFDLQSGSYATVALRELLHWEMDKEAQKNAQAPKLQSSIPTP